MASRLFATDMDVRVLRQGASDRTLSFLVDESKVEESVRRLHSAFSPKLEPMPTGEKCLLPQATARDIDAAVADANPPLHVEPVRHTVQFHDAGLP